jgi:arylsulfatase
MLAVGALLGWLAASGRLATVLAQDKKAEPTPALVGGTPDVLPRPDFHFPGNVGRTYLDLRDGKPTFVYNYLGVERPTVAAQDALPKGKSRVVVDFKYDGGGLGKGGTVTMSANGTKVAEGRLERTVPLVISLQEGLDIGMDNGSPVDFTYKPPFTFTGKIEKVTIELK